MESWNLVVEGPPSSTLSISQEVLRSVLYGKWCNVFGGQKELTFKSSFLDKAEYPSDEGETLMHNITTITRHKLVPHYTSYSRPTKRRFSHSWSCQNSKII